MIGREKREREERAMRDKRDVCKYASKQASK